MDRSGANRSFENSHIGNSLPTNFISDDFINDFSPATVSCVDSMLDFIFNDDSNSSASSDSTISDEPRGEPSTIHTIGNLNPSSTSSIENGNYQANGETEVLQKLNKKIKKVEREVEELRRSISILCRK